MLEKQTRLINGNTMRKMFTDPDNKEIIEELICRITKRDLTIIKIKVPRDDEIYSRENIIKINAVDENGKKVILYISISDDRITCEANKLYTAGQIKKIFKSDNIERDFFHIMIVTNNAKMCNLMMPEISYNFNVTNKEKDTVIFPKLCCRTYNVDTIINCYDDVPEDCKYLLAFINDERVKDFTGRDELIKKLVDCISKAEKAIIYNQCNIDADCADEILKFKDYYYEEA